MIKDAGFFLPGGRAGVLLIHGLTGTPAEMQILAKGLNRAGFTVMGVQLAGHCGTAEDLLQTGWRDWYRSVEQASAALRKQVDIMFVGGLSMGAVLALKLAEDYPGQVAGVGVYSVIFRHDGWSVPFYARKFGFMVRWFKKFGLFRHKIFIERPPYGLKDERIRKTVSESMLAGDSAAAGLAGNPFPSLAELMELSRITRKGLGKVTAPCLIMHATEDDTANIATNAELAARRVSGPAQLVPLENSYHLITIDRDRKKVIEATAAFFAALCPPGSLETPIAPQAETAGAAAMTEAAEQRAESA